MLPRSLRRVWSPPQRWKRWRSPAPRPCQTRQRHWWRRYGTRWLLRRRPLRTPHWPPCRKTRYWFLLRRRALLPRRLRRHRRQMRSSLRLLPPPLARARSSTRGGGDLAEASATRRRSRIRPRQMRRPLLRQPRRPRPCAKPITSGQATLMRTSHPARMTLLRSTRT